MSSILMIQILDYQDTPPSIAAKFWWSSERGLTCDNPRMLIRLQHEGILLTESRRVYPTDGRAFFDALHFRFTGLRRAQKPVQVELQEGNAL